MPKVEADYRIAVVLAITVVICVVGIVFSHDNMAQTTQIVGFCAMVAVSLIALLRSESNTREVAEKVADVATVAHIRADRVAEKVDKVKEALAVRSIEVDEKLIEIADTTKATHGLVNSNMEVQLELNANLARRLAELAVKFSLESAPADIKAAEDAERLLRDHRSQGPQPPPPKTPPNPYRE